MNTTLTKSVLKVIEHTVAHDFAFSGFQADAFGRERLYFKKYVSENVYMTLSVARKNCVKNIENIKAAFQFTNEAERTSSVEEVKTLDEALAY